MATGGPFPTTDSQFNTYINAVIPYLDTNKARLGVSTENMDALLALLGDASTAGSWADIYPKSQIPNTRTTTITGQKNELRKQLEDLLRTVYADIPESSLTDPDRNTLNLPKRDSEPTPRPIIETLPSLSLKPIGGGRIHVECRVEKDSTRPSMHPDADIVELRYKVGDPAPTQPSEAPNGFNSSRSNWAQPVDMGDLGKRFYCYARWANTSDASKNGPWSLLYQVIVA